MRFKTMQRTAYVVMGGLLIFMALLIFIGVKACGQLSSEINDKGLKGVVEELWEGEKK